MSNAYRYGDHQDMTPTELFFLIATGEFCEQMGIDDVEGVILILAGWLLLPTRQKFGGATKGTSVASVASRALFRYKFKHEILPTLTLQSVKSLRVIMTRRLAVFIGRAVPGVGWILLARDVAIISGFDFHRYFLMDGEGLLYSLIRRFVVGRRHSLARELTTLAMLCRAMLDAKWGSIWLDDSQ